MPRDAGVSDTVRRDSLGSPDVWRSEIANAATRSNPFSESLLRKRNHSTDHIFSSQTDYLTDHIFSRHSQKLSTAKRPIQTSHCHPYELKPLPRLILYSRKLLHTKKSISEFCWIKPKSIGKLYIYNLISFLFIKRFKEDFSVCYKVFWSPCKLPIFEDIFTMIALLCSKKASLFTRIPLTSFNG